MFPGKSQSRLIFCGPPVFRWLSLTGTVEVLETPEARERIWREGDEQYYPPKASQIRITASYGSPHRADGITAGSNPKISHCNFMVLQERCSDTHSKRMKEIEDEIRFYRN